MDHEEAFIRSFIVREKRPRWREFLRSNRRDDALSTLRHSNDIEWQYAEQFNPTGGLFGGPFDSQDEWRKAHVEQTFEALRALGAPARCYVIALNSSLDGQEVDLRDALEDVILKDATLISCIPGRLVYFQAEDCRYILQRPR
jgi:hypothetical protein